jgi:hypothetical protein
VRAIELTSSLSGQRTPYVVIAGEVMKERSERNQSCWTARNDLRGPCTLAVNPAEGELGAVP